VENAIYNAVTDSWMIPQADPFTLENFQQAYDNLASGEALQTITRAQSEEFPETEQLDPTHYALRIYPKSEEEQWRVELMEEVGVVYAPFNYSSLSEEEIGRVSQTRSTVASPFEVSPYTVTRDHPESTTPVTYQLPILYAVWPVDKPLPEDLEYKLDYEVFVPQEFAQTRSSEDVRLLVTEAFALASDNPTEYIAAIEAFAATGDFPATRADDGGTVLEWDVLTPDDVVDRDIPMANLKVALQRSSYIVNSETGTDGFVEVELPYYLPVSGYSYMDFTVTYTYQDPQGRWKIVPNYFNVIPNYIPEDNYYTTIPYSITHSVKAHGTPGGPLNGFMPYQELPTVVLTDSYRNENRIHRAVNYFYNTQTVFPKPTYPIRIAVLDMQGDSTTYDEYGIFMYRGDIATTFHELTHLLPEPTLSSSLNSNHRLFFGESFADFGGWYLGKEYYKSIGWTEPANYSSSIAGSLNCLYWTKDSSNWYTPFYVDLYDNYNQSTTNSDLLNDQIKEVPISVLLSIYISSGDWSQLKLNLQKYVGTGSGKYFTQAQLDLLLDYFDEWFENTKHYI
jgi:hypothetical protein